MLEGGSESWCGEARRSEARPARLHRTAPASCEHDTTLCDEVLIKDGYASRALTSSCRRGLGYALCLARVVVGDRKFDVCGSSGASDNFSSAIHGSPASPCCTTPAAIFVPAADRSSINYNLHLNSTADRLPWRQPSSRRRHSAHIQSDAVRQRRAPDYCARIAREPPSGAHIQHLHSAGTSEPCVRLSAPSCAALSQVTSGSLFRCFLLPASAPPQVPCTSLCTPFLPSV